MDFAPIAFLLVALLAGALLKLLLARVNIPYTVGLFVVGLVIGTLHHFGMFDSAPMLKSSIAMACSIDPELILNIFLPILIFSAAYELDIHIFRKTLTNSSLLSVPGVIIAMVLTAALMVGLSYVAPAYSGWNWSYALMFGALISATDPVAVVALLGELSVSKRFSTLIDGESMLNDGTGIVFFMLFYAPFTATVTTSAHSPFLSFLVVVAGGLVIGYLFARLFVFFSTRVIVRGDMMLLTSAMILLSYLTFIFAQDIFKLSGVIALVTFGLTLAYQGVDKIDERTREFMKLFWSLLAYVANTLIFIIIGIIISDKVQFTWSDLIVLLIVYVGVNIIRALMITILYPLLKRSGYGLSKREAVILSWGALRGAVGLTLALMVSYTESIPEEVRRQILLLTAGIVTLTLVINATTMKWLLGKLGMLRSTAARELLRINVHNMIHDRTVDFVEDLKGREAMKVADWDAVEQILPLAIDKSDETPSNGDMLAGIRLQLLSYQRATIWSLYKRGVIAIEAQRKLIDILDQLVDSDGYAALDTWLGALKVTANHRLPSNSFVRSNKWLRYATFYIYFKSPEYRYEVAYGSLIASKRLKESLKELLNSSTINKEQINDIYMLENEINRVVESCSTFINNFAITMPEEYSEVLTLRAKRMVIRHERQTIYNLVVEGMIDSEAASELIAEIDRKK